LNGECIKKYYIVGVDLDKRLVLSLSFHYFDTMSYWTLYKDES